MAREQPPDAVVLDLMLPDTNGFRVCEQLRTFNPVVPIIMLTARSEEIDKIRGLQVTIATTAKNDAEAIRLLELYGMPFIKDTVEA